MISDIARFERGRAAGRKGTYRAHVAGYPFFLHSGTGTLQGKVRRQMAEFLLTKRLDVPGVVCLPYAAPRATNVVPGV